jgi:hypothetical protein
VSKQFEGILEEMNDLHDRKQQDYGTAKDPFANVRASEEFGIPGWLGAVIRANDKMSRLKSFAEKGVLANEPLEDSLIDLASYAVIALILYREVIANAKAMDGGRNPRTERPEKTGTHTQADS